MKLNDVFNNPKEIRELDFIINEKQFEFLRDIADHLSRLDEKEFSVYFDYFLTKSHFIPWRSDDFPILSYIEDESLTSFVFMRYLNYKIFRGIYVLDNYLEHTTNINKPISQELEDTYDEYHFKLDFIKLKYRELSFDGKGDTDSQIENAKVKKNTESLVEGKRLNLYDRFELLNRLFDFNSKVNSMNISDSDKDKLLSLILGCNQTNARHVKNGKYAAKPQVDLIDRFINHLQN